MLQGACQHPGVETQLAESALRLAPAWHTRALVGLLLAVAATGTLLGRAVEPLPATWPLWQSYLPLVAVNVGLVSYVCGLGLERNVLARLLVQLGYDRRRLLVDLTWGGGLALALFSAENALQSLVGFPASIAAHALAAATTSERIAWGFVAVLVGFSEELVYRGYLQRQLSALSGRQSFGIAAQALLFGIAHGEQGAWVVARFAAYALALGWVAARRQSLVPGILCHVAIDWVAGLAG